MTATLYTTDILRLAMQAGLHPRLPDADASEAAQTPVCGSRITVDVRIDGAGMVTAVGFDLHACAMGQAAAGLFADGALGRDAADLKAVAFAMAEWMSGARQVPPVWPGIEQLAPARAYPARHAAILLPFRAGAMAAEKAQAAQKAA